MEDHDRYARFTRLLLQSEPEILRAVLVVVPNRADARDVVQETAVTLWQHFENYDEGRPFANWAIGYARMQVRRYLRAGARRAMLTERAAELITAMRDEQASRQEQRDAALRACLEEMPTASRTILTGYYFEERSVEAIGEAVGRSTEAIYKTLQRLRAALLECVTARLSEA